jgi:hypothetical protein
VANPGSITISRSGLKYLVLSLVLEIAILYLGYREPESKVISALGLVLCLLYTIKFRKSMIALFPFLFFASYNYAAVQFFYQGIEIAYFKGFGDALSVNKIVVINSVFIFTLGNTISSYWVTRKMDLDAKAYKSKYMFWLLFAVGVLMIQFGIQGQNMLVSGGYGAGATKTSMHEYFILVYFLILLVKPRGNIVYTIAVWGIYLVYCVKTLLFGGRVEIMEISILLLAYYWLLPKKENRVLLILLILFAFYVSNIISHVRTNPVRFLKGDYISYFNPFYETPRNNKSVKRALGNNQGDVLQSSGRMLALVEDGIMDNGTRIKSFFSMLGSIVLPTSALPVYTNLAAFHQVSPYRSGGGGLVSVYFYVWMGYLGPVLIGLFLGSFINKGFKPGVNFAFRIYAVILLIMYPRWFAYGPIIIFKFCFLTAMMYVVTQYIFVAVFKSKAKLLPEGLK